MAETTQLDAELPLTLTAVYEEEIAITVEERSEVNAAALAANKRVADAARTAAELIMHPHN